MVATTAWRETLRSGGGRFAT